MDLKGLKANRENRETDGPGSSMYTGGNEAVQTTLRQFMKVITRIPEESKGSKHLETKSKNPTGSKQLDNYLRVMKEVERKKLTSFSYTMSIANWVIRHEWVLHLRLRVDLHGRIIFTRVHKIEAMFERPRVNVDTFSFTRDLH